MWSGTLVFLCGFRLFLFTNVLPSCQERCHHTLRSIDVGQSHHATVLCVTGKHGRLIRQAAKAFRLTPYVSRWLAQWRLTWACVVWWSARVLRGLSHPEKCLSLNPLQHFLEPHLQLPSQLSFVGGRAWHRGLQSLWENRKSNSGISALAGSLHYCNPSHDDFFC